MKNVIAQMQSGYLRMFVNIKHQPNVLFAEFHGSRVCRDRSSLSRLCDATRNKGWQDHPLPRILESCPLLAGSTQIFANLLMQSDAEEKRHEDRLQPHQYWTTLRGKITQAGAETVLLTRHPAKLADWKVRQSR